MYVCKGAGGGGLSQKNFFGPSDLTLVLNKGGGTAPRDLPVMWIGISSPSQCWRGGSVLWTTFFERKKIII